MAKTVSETFIQVMLCNYIIWKNQSTRVNVIKKGDQSNEKYNFDPLLIS